MTSNRSKCACITGRLSACKIFFAKQKTAKLKINNVQNQSEETVVSSLKDDGFDHIRKKGKLRTHAEKLLKE